MKGDIILAVNGQPVTDSRSLSLKISDLTPGSDVRIRFARNGKESETNIKLGELPAESAQENPADNATGGDTQIGLSVEPLTPQIARQLGLNRSTVGVVVTEVEPGSAADDAGLQRGDVVQEINRKAISSVDDFQSAVRQASNQSILMLIARGSSHLYVLIGAR